MKEIVNSQRWLYDQMVRAEKPLDDIYEKDVFSSKLKTAAFFTSMGLALFFVPFLIYILDGNTPPLYVSVLTGLCAIAVIFLFLASFVPQMRIRMSKEYRGITEARRKFWRELSEFTHEIYGFKVEYDESKPPPCHFVQDLQIYANSVHGMERIEVELLDDRIIFFTGDKEVKPNAYNEEIAVPLLDTKPLAWMDVLEAANKNTRMKKHLETAKMPSGNMEELLKIHS
ncbi:MAG: hypothetical protein H9W81_02545 [Enterococcus sp.]|nr:hypothetical protein [Enterococcus sp.]